MYTRENCLYTVSYVDGNSDTIHAKFYDTTESRFIFYAAVINHDDMGAPIDTFITEEARLYRDMVKEIRRV